MASELDGEELFVLRLPKDTARKVSDAIKSKTLEERLKLDLCPSMTPHTHMHTRAPSADAISPCYPRALTLLSRVRHALRYFWRAALWRR